MCPFCLTTVAMVVGTGAATGLTALLLGKGRAEQDPRLSDVTPKTEER